MFSKGNEESLLSALKFYKYNDTQIKLDLSYLKIDKCEFITKKTIIEYVS